MKKIGVAIAKGVLFFEKVAAGIYFLLFFCSSFHLNRDFFLLLVVPPISSVRPRSGLWPAVEADEPPGPVVPVHGGARLPEPAFVSPRCLPGGGVAAVAHLLAVEALHQAGVRALQRRSQA